MNFAAMLLSAVTPVPRAPGITPRVASRLDEYVALMDGAALTVPQLVTLTGDSERTVRRTLARLMADGIVTCGSKPGENAAGHVVQVKTYRQAEDM